MTLAPVDVVAIFAAVLLANMVTLAVAAKLVDHYLLGPPVDPDALEGGGEVPGGGLQERAPEETGAELDLEGE